MTEKSLSDKVQEKAYKALLLISSVLMGFMSYAGVMSFFSSDSVIRLICLFTLVPAFFFFVVLIHEMGHALAAWALKYRVHFIAVGRYGFNPEIRKFQKVNDYSNNELAGFVQCSPRWPVESRWAEIIVSVAGPFATLTLGLLLLWGHNHFRTHQGFMFLAFVCFLDASFNLLPLKSGNKHNSDGRSIFESLFKSEWTVESWLNSRSSAAYYYEQDYCSDKEWREFRLQCWQSHSPDYKQVLRHIAWIKTDPAAFIAITNINRLKTDISTNHVMWQYIVSSVLLGQDIQNLEKLMPEEIETEDNIYHFAKVLLAHGDGNTLAAVHAINGARESYTKEAGGLPDEEDAIFRAIEDGRPLPALKWANLP